MSSNAVIEKPAVKARPALPAKQAIRQAIASLRESFPFPRYAQVSEEAAEEIAGTVMRHLAPGARVLDFGCGPMYKAAVLQTLGYQCSGTDDLQDECFTPENVHTFRDYARRMGMDFRLAGKDANFPASSFDLVSMNDVIEHLHDSPRELLNDLLTLVRPEGYLLITVPNAANIRKRVDLLRGRTNLPRFASFYWTMGPWRGHMREYVESDLRALARFLKLRLLELRTYHHMIDVLPKLLRPAYRAVTCVCPGWRDSWLLLAQKPPGWEPCRVLPAEWTEVTEESSSLHSWGGNAPPKVE